MAVYKRTYKPYSGELTANWTRFAIVPRYSLAKIFDSKILIGLLLVSLLPFLVAATIIYLSHNPIARTLIGMRGENIISVDNRFFFQLLKIQGSLAFLITAWIGPGLVSPDLTNNALPLYLCRPFSRVEYVLGKISVLFVLLSLVTWVPDLFLYGLQAELEGNGWLTANLSIAYAIVLGSLLWITVQSLLALALSAWVKWRIAASGLMFAIFFVAAGFGEAFNQVLRTYWGHTINLVYLIDEVWADLFSVPIGVGITSRTRIGDPRLLSVPLGVAWLILLSVCAVCLLLLNRRLRAREVVR
jgi:ABC-2 type transport system permease protein